MATYRKTSGKQRNEHEEMNVRFDYSETYLDNECLTNELEEKEYELLRERRRMFAESNESIKKATKDANDMLNLKDAIKNRDPNESSDKVVKSADYKKRQKLPRTTSHDGKGLERVSTEVRSREESDEVDSKSKPDNANEINIETVVDEAADKKTSESFKSKPLNTLTMFLLSIQNFKKSGNQCVKNETGNKNAKKTASALPEVLQSPKEGQKSDKVRKEDYGRNGKLSKRPASYHVGQTRVTRPPTGDDQRAQSQYGIHAKKDYTRSRRKLEEICQIEQNSKYGPVNKYEERRKKLLSACRDTKSLDDRIKHFLKDVDEFNTLSRAENSLEKVLLRAKSARVSRTNTFAW